MGLKLGQNFEKLESFCIKNYRKISLGFSMKKEIDQFIIFFFLFVNGKAFFKELLAFWGAYSSTDLIRNMQSYKWFK